MIAIIFIALPLLVGAEGIDYTVEFSGIDNPSLLKIVRATSSLINLRKKSPSSFSALHFRAESDVPDIKKALHAFGYFDAHVTLAFEERESGVVVLVHVIPGSVYKLEKYTIQFMTPAKMISLRAIGIDLGEPFHSKEIIRGELKLLERLSNYGYPLGKVAKRSIVADGDTKMVDVALNVDPGPFCRFGSLSVTGLTSTRKRFIKKKIEWTKREPYKNALVEKTQDALIKTGLFTSVLITHDEKLDEKGTLPMHVAVTEGKHRSVNLGVSYQTFFGPGLTFGWENRNIRGMGRKFSIQGDVTKRSHSGLATLLLPDFYHKGQNYIWQAQAMHESITAYGQMSYTLLTRLERQFGRRFSSSAGFMLEQMNVWGSVKNGTFLLFEIPLYSRWSSANSILNPTKGGTLEWNIVPSMNIDAIKSYYLLQELVLSHYLPVNESHSVVCAQKITLGSIISPRLGIVPVPKRFLGGSEEDLRGYKYKTVSALDGHKPIGGRSAIYYTFETRLRATKTLGFVPFFDLGNVYATQFPTFDKKWFKSVGLGFRYFSMIGPIRFDIGFPLDRRKGIDPRYRVLVSIGQMF